MPLLVVTVILSCLMLMPSFGGRANGEGRSGAFRGLVVSTWWTEKFAAANGAAWDALQTQGRVAAVVAGGSACERLQCDGTVGYGGSPDESGETTLDALVMDGQGQRMGAVGDLRRVSDAAKVAWAVMNHTRHSLLVGESATRFALQMGFPARNLTTAASASLFASWRKNHCQPNFWRNVWPNPATSCGPYKPAAVSGEWAAAEEPYASRSNHDTIGLVVVDHQRKVAVGTSTNGADHKVHGRVGDSPIPGAGAFVDASVGGAAATGDGDVMMRFLPSYQTVEGMRSGLKPSEAAAAAIARVAAVYPTFTGAVVAGDRKGRHGAACHGLPTFSYSLSNADSQRPQKITVKCV